MNRELRKTLNRYKPFFLPIGVIIAAVAVFFLMIVPLTQQTITRFEEIEAAEEQLSLLENKLAVLNAADETELEQLLNAAVSAISIERSLPGIMRTVETIANDSNVVLDTVLFDQTSKLASEAAKALSDGERQFGAYRIPFTITTSSGFNELRTFLENTMNVRRFIRARSFILNFGDVDQTNTQIKFDAFYLPLQTKNVDRQLVALSAVEKDFLQRIVTMKDASSLFVLDESTQQIIDSGENRNPFE